jgi:hypothetical protein
MRALRRRVVYKAHMLRTLPALGRWFYTQCRGLGIASSPGIASTCQDVPGSGAAGLHNGTQSLGGDSSARGVD